MTTRHTATIPARHVGIDVAPVGDLASCPRCGRTRRTRTDRPGIGLCRDCWDVEPGWPRIEVTC